MNKVSGLLGRDVRENVRAGDLGGFVQSEKNLSQDGQSWIADNAVAADNNYNNFINELQPQILQ